LFWYSFPVASETNFILWPKQFYPQRFNPYKNFKFRVTIDDITVATLNDATGLNPTPGSPEKKLRKKNAGSSEVWKYHAQTRFNYRYKILRLDKRFIQSVRNGVRRKTRSSRFHPRWDKIVTTVGEDRVSEEISIIVDVDDKNCLAELTVVLKLNQGVRQWLSR
jgi:hypothetical protein